MNPGDELWQEIFCHLKTAEGRATTEKLVQIYTKTGTAKIRPQLTEDLGKLLNDLDTALATARRRLGEINEKAQL